MDVHVYVSFPETLLLLGCSIATTAVTGKALATAHDIMNQSIFRVSCQVLFTAENGSSGPSLFTRCLTIILDTVVISSFHACIVKDLR